jgi:hypothetical protein
MPEEPIVYVRSGSFATELADPVRKSMSAYAHAK